jgi:hypothetical protein
MEKHFMKKALLGVLILLGYLHAGANSGAESRISIEPKTQAPLNAGTTHFKFELLDENTKKTVGDQDLVDSHTKKLHLIAYDASLNEFNHVHPSYNGNIWETELALPVNGIYFVWAQGQLQDGTEFSAVVKTQVQGGKLETPPTPLGDHRKASDKGTVIELAATKVKAGKMVMLNFRIYREDGQPPQITPYLGAFAHVIAASPEGDELIHVHPMEGNTPDTGMLHATFPTEGDYRVWVQLIDNGELKTIPLSVSVFK